MGEHNRPNDELFLKPPTPRTIDPRSTPQPLRINKANSASPPSRSGYAAPEDGSGGAGGVNFHLPPQSPPPTGAIPPIPPYPTSQPGRQATSSADRRPAARGDIPTPKRSAEEGRGGVRRTSMPGSDHSSSTNGGGRRTRFDASDPARPTVSGYAASPPGKNARLAERRGTPVISGLPESPGGPEPPEKDDEDLFQKPVRKNTADTAAAAAGAGTPASSATFLDYHRQFYPPPLTSGTPAQTAAQSGAFGTLHIPSPAGVNRLSSTASASTTRASRGSPPPPETPVDDAQPAGAFAQNDIAARYAASGIPGTSTLNEIQAQNAAAAARMQAYAQPRARQGSAQGLRPAHIQSPGPQPFHAPPRSWSPTERPGSAPHGPPVTFQGAEEVSSDGAEGPGQTPPRAPASDASSGRSGRSGRSDRTAGDRAGSGAPTYPRPPRPTSIMPENPIETGMAGMSIHDEPPPAYSPPTNSSQYPDGKGRYPGASPSPANPQGTAASASGASGPRPNTGNDLRQHPAFANDPPMSAQQQQQTLQGQHASPSPQPMRNGSFGGPHRLAPINVGHTPSPAPSGAGPASPPPLPEGWIAHLDPNSGQYYYIHLPTQSTQWEFPKGPTPLNLQEPMSPGGTFVNALNSPAVTTFGGKQPFASPGFPVAQLASYPDHRASSLSMASLSSPTAAGFSGPPPSAGVDMYRIAPTNGVYFGPYLRYTNTDLERGLWLGSIMLVTDAPTPPTIHIHQSADLSPNPRQLKGHPIYSHARYIFYRYDVDLPMDDDASAKWTYAITSHLGCTRYEFLVAGRHETSWRFIAHSGNDFALAVSANERAKLGGVGHMWKDVLQKHAECGGFHAQLGLGGQIYADRLWRDVPALRAWTQTSGKETRRNFPWSPRLDEDVTHAYFHYYTSHFDQAALREAFAQIPHVLCLDDHDLFDGWGSYPDHMQGSHVFRHIGRIGVDMYLLFQHHTTHEILRNVSSDLDLFTITGQGWHFVKYLGPAVVVVGPDTRSERSGAQVMAGATYQGLFPKVATLPPSVQHCLWLFPVPLVYPRLESVEQAAHAVQTGKKVVTGSFNMLGRVAGGVAGVVGAKGVVRDGFGSIKQAVGKSGLMSGVLSPFGELGVGEELRDLWTHDSKDLERTYIIRTLQGIAHNKSLRMTFLSGGVNCCGAGLVHDPAHPSDHKTMYQLISASIVNAPPPAFVLRMLHNTSGSGGKALYVPLNGHRSGAGHAAPSDTKEDMMEIFAADVDGRPREMRRLMARRNYLACVAYDPEVVQGTFGAMVGGGGGGEKGAGRLSLAADFMVQSEGLGVPMKYGPVIVPSLEYGR